MMDPTPVTLKDFHENIIECSQPSSTGSNVQRLLLAAMEEGRLCISNSIV